MKGSGEGELAHCHHSLWKINFRNESTLTEDLVASSLKGIHEVNSWKVMCTFRFI